jgi:cell division protein FtsI/penicillin-binding protein 2
MIPDSRKQIRFRAYIVGIFFALILTIIGARAVYLQIFRSSWLSEKAANLHEVSSKYSGKRGTIYDKNFKEMAISTIVTSI